MGGSLGLALRAPGGVRGARRRPRPRGAAGRRWRSAPSRTARRLARGGAPRAPTRSSCSAAPVAALAGLARRALAAERPGVRGDRPRLDQGRRRWRRSSPAERERFIGGHPVCGGERTGVAFARAGALPRRHLVPHARAPRRGRSSSSACTAWSPRSAPGRWRSTRDVHDRLMALVSHLPHVLAGALVNQAAATAPGGREALRSAGPSFVDLTRVAGSNPPLWADILLANAAAVLEALRGLLGAPRRRARRPSSAATATGCSASSATPAEAREPPAPGRGPRPGAPRPGDRRPSPTARAPSPRSPPPSGHAHINIEDLSLRPGPPDGEGELVLLLEGPEAAQRGRAPRGRARLPRPGGMSTAAGAAPALGRPRPTALPMHSVTACSRKDSLMRGLRIAALRRRRHRRRLRSAVGPPATGPARRRKTRSGRSTWPPADVAPDLGEFTDLPHAARSPLRPAGDAPRSASDSSASTSRVQRRRRARRAATRPPPPPPAARRGCARRTPRRRPAGGRGRPRRGCRRRASARRGRSSASIPSKAAERGMPAQGVGHRVRGARGAPCAGGSRCAPPRASARPRQRARAPRGSPRARRSRARRPGRPSGRGRARAAAVGGRARRPARATRSGWAQREGDGRGRAHRLARRAPRARRRGASSTATASATSSS